MENSVLQMSHDDREVLNTLGISEEMLLNGTVFKFTVIDAFAGDGGTDGVQTSYGLKRKNSQHRKHP